MSNILTEKRSNSKESLSFKTKVGYGLAEAGSQLSWTVIGSFLILFYTDVVGLAPAVISAIMLGARIWDAVNDPMFGVIADNTNTRWGKFRPYILFGTPLLALFQILTFTNLNVSLGLKTLWCAATYVFCGMAYTAVSISVASLGSVLTNDSNERVKLMSYRGVMATIAGFLINATAMPMILYFGGGKTNSPRGYFIAAVIFSLLAIPCLWITVATTKEKVHVSQSKKDKLPLSKVLKIIVSNRNIVLSLIASVFVLTGIFGRIGIMTYYYIYVLGRPDLIAPLCTILTVSMVIPNFICPPLMKIWNKKVVAAIGCVFGAISCVILFIGGLGYLPCAYIGSFLLGASSFGPICGFGITGDIIDDIEVKNNIRNEGIIFSAMSFSTKLGNAIGGALGISLIGAVGYVANAQQTATAVKGINMVTNLLPGLCMLLGAIPYLMLKITNKQAEENTEILIERRKELI